MKRNTNHNKIQQNRIRTRSIQLLLAGSFVLLTGCGSTWEEVTGSLSNNENAVEFDGFEFDDMNTDTTLYYVEEEATDPNETTPLPVEPESSDSDDSTAPTTSEITNPVVEEDSPTIPTTPETPIPEEVLVEDLTCEAAPSCGTDKTCIPRNTYGHAAACEYFNDERNYCYADDMCYNRACSMVDTVSDLCPDRDLRGPDGQWCTEAQAQGNTCDDLAKKVIIRYKPGSKWSYHIASVIKTCEDGWCVIDPIGKPGATPTTTCRTPEEWCNTWAHDNDGDGTTEKGDDWVWGDTSVEPTDKDVCELAPGNQEFFSDSACKDPYDEQDNDEVCRELANHVKEQCMDGLQPFPAACGKDKDGDGIPNKYDVCPNSDPADVAAGNIDYCNAGNFGCKKM